MDQYLVGGRSSIRQVSLSPLPFSLLINNFSVEMMMQILKIHPSQSPNPNEPFFMGPFHWHPRSIEKGFSKEQLLFRTSTPWWKSTSFVLESGCEICNPFFHWFYIRLKRIFSTKYVIHYNEIILRTASRDSTVRIRNGFYTICYHG